MTKPIIVLILKALEGRGAERMVTTLARAYVEMNYNVHVLCLEATQEMSLDSRVHYHLIPYYQIFSKQQFSENSEQVQSYRAVAKRIDDYIFNHIGLPNLILANIYKMNWIMAYSQLPNIVNVLHTALSKQFEDELSTNPTQIVEHLKMVYGAHPCSAVSAGACNDLRNIIGDLNRTTTIYNPCAVNEIKRSALQPFDFEHYGLEAHGYIICVASFDTMKNHRDLLYAYARTEQKQPLVLVGKGRLEDEIRALAIKLGITERIKFVGFQANPYPLMAAAAVLVLSSKFEGFGYVIVEAQALEVPIISTDCPFGPRELLPAQNLVAVGDVEGLAQLMDKAMNAPNNYKVSLNQKFLPAQIAQQYLNFIQVDY